MPVLNLMVQHGRTLEDARRGLETAVYRVSGQFGSLVRRTEWTPDRQQVKLEIAAVLRSRQQESGCASLMDLANGYILRLVTLRRA
jgi:hypothetical protein